MVSTLVPSVYVMRSKDHRYGISSVGASAFGDQLFGSLSGLSDSPKYLTTDFTPLPGSPFVLLHVYSFTSNGG